MCRKIGSQAYALPSFYSGCAEYFPPAATAGLSALITTDTLFPLDELIT